MKKSLLRKMGAIAIQMHQLRQLMEEEQGNIECKASDHCREMTDNEQDKWDELDGAREDLQGAIDYLEDYLMESDEYMEKKDELGVY